MEGKEKPRPTSNDKIKIGNAYILQNSQPSRKYNSEEISHK